MRIPLYLAVAQWALLLALGCLVVLLYRQLGRLLGQSGGHAELGPPVGSTAARFRYERVPDGTAGELSPGDGVPALIAFVDPTCPACEQLVTSLSDAEATGELAGLRILLLVSDPPGYLGISAAFQATSLEIGRPLSTAEVASYRAVGTPLLVAIDGTGVVRAAGTASRPAEVRVYRAAAARDSDDQSRQHGKTRLEESDSTPLASESEVTI
jgi:hypothetical protein